MGFRYSEKYMLDSIENKIALHIFDDNVDLFQILKVGNEKQTNSVGMTKETALKIASMITQHYGAKK